MPPKAKYAREEIVESAFQLVREKGADALTARELAEKLSTSPRPIFTAFEGMNDLKAEVISRCTQLYLSFCENEKASGKYPEYKSLGMAYIRLAKQEKNIFKLLFMRDTSNENYNSQNELFNIGRTAVGNQLNLNFDSAERLHTEVWIWVHGIASALATSYVDIDFDTISDMLSEVYLGLKGRYENE